MKKFTQAQKQLIWAVVLSAALGSLLTDEEWAKKLGISLRAFMNHKKKAKGLLEKILETEANK